MRGVGRRCRREREESIRGTWEVQISRVEMVAGGGCMRRRERGKRHGYDCMDNGLRRAHWT